jgi:hypothetical protein
VADTKGAFNGKTASLVDLFCFHNSSPIHCGLICRQMRIVRLFSGIMFLVFGSCTEPSQIGTNFFREGSLGIFYTDTFSLKVSTLTSDSKVTGNLARPLLEYQQHNELEEIYSSAFFQMEPRSTDSKGELTIYNLDNKSTYYNKTSLVLRNDSFSYYDTTCYQTLYASELADEIEAEENRNLYNTTNTKVNTSPIVQLLFRPASKSGESIEISLSDRLGNVTNLRTFVGDHDLSLKEQFVEDVLKGLVLVPDTTVSRVVVGLNCNTKLRVLYLDCSIVPHEEKYFRFFVSSRCFNNFSAGKISSPLQLLKTQKESISSVIINRKAYITDGTPPFSSCKSSERYRTKAFSLNNPSYIGLSQNSSRRWGDFWEFFPDDEYDDAT